MSDGTNKPTVTPNDVMRALIKLGLKFWSNETGEDDIWMLDMKNAEGESVELSVDVDGEGGWVMYSSEWGGVWSVGRGTEEIERSFLGLIEEAMTPKTGPVSPVLE